MSRPFYIFSRVLFKNVIDLQALFLCRANSLPRTASPMARIEIKCSIQMHNPQVGHSMLSDSYNYCETRLFKIKNNNRIKPSIAFIKINIPVIFFCDFPNSWNAMSMI